MKIVVMGPPGGGKGTQCPNIVERYGVCHLSMGDMLRAAVAAKTANGVRAKEVMDAGKLVSNEIVFDIVRDAMAAPACERGWVLDGLPRTLEQAKLMDKLGFGVQRVLAFDVPDEILVKRLSGRWTHQPSGRSYHTEFHPPKVEGKDDVTGEPLTQRADDTAAVVTKRLATFHDQTVPIYDYYRQQRMFDMIDGNRAVKTVKAAVFQLLDKFFKPFNAAA